MTIETDIRELALRIYGTDIGSEVFSRLIDRVRRANTTRPSPGPTGGRFSQDQVFLITYADSLKQPDTSPLRALAAFADRYLTETVSHIHLLPFFPYSSDDGFSVTDFYSVNPAVGSWADVDHLASRFQLMFDYVLNHVSAKGDWFSRYLKMEPGYADLAIELDPDTDTSGVTRPRALPLLTPFKKADGRTVHVWTTFSDDQVDLNYRSVDVLDMMVDVLFHYIQRGAAVLRLDAVAYLWKEIGTPCIHLPQTHDMVKLFRKLLDAVLPDVMLITETNVPHRENISYFGNGEDEAQMVYNFTLPPLLLSAFITQDATALSQWAATLDPPSAQTTFFNFTASHDGIGVRPLEGILPGDAMSQLLDAVSANGGRISYKANSDGSTSPYELNITYVDALKPPGGGGGDAAHARRFLASQAIQLALPGVPAIYIGSLIGARNWQEGVARSGHNRRINRQKFSLHDILDDLNDPGNFRAQVFFPYLDMIRKRRRQPAFHPNAGCRVMHCHQGVFAVRRSGMEQTITALTNITPTGVSLRLDPHLAPGRYHDLLSGHDLDSERIDLAPYQSVWLTGES